MDHAWCARAPTLRLIVSTLLTFSIEPIATFGVSYGPLDVVVAVIPWFLVTTNAVSLGAEPNPQREPLSAATITPATLVPHAI
jgi:hypothetical protein